MTAGVENRMIRVWEMMSMTNESRVRSRSKPISLPSWARVGLGFLPFWRGCCSGCGC